MFQLCINGFVIVVYGRDMNLALILCDWCMDVHNGFHGIVAQNLHESWHRIAFVPFIIKNLGNSWLYFYVYSLSRKHLQKYHIFLCFSWLVSHYLGAKSIKEIEGYEVNDGKKEVKNMDRECKCKPKRCQNMPFSQPRNE